MKRAGNYCKLLKCVENGCKRLKLLKTATTKKMAETVENAKAAIPKKIGRQKTTFKKKLHAMTQHTKKYINTKFSHGLDPELPGCETL